MIWLARDVYPQAIFSGFGKLCETKQEVFHERRTDHYPINPGNSDGSLVDSDDRIVGINSTALMGAQSNNVPTFPFRSISSRSSVDCSSSLLRREIPPMRSASELVN